MKFKVGDRVKYVGWNNNFYGCSGVIIRECPRLRSSCKVVKMSNGSEQHVYIKYLKLNQKNQQLLFDFMKG